VFGPVGISCDAMVDLSAVSVAVLGTLRLHFFGISSWNQSFYFFLGKKAIKPFQLSFKGVLNGPWFFQLPLGIFPG